MIFGSVCSGIEAASVAWHPLGWQAAFLSEIEPFPRAVLAHHYPDTPLHGDFTTIEEGQYAAIDVLVGGTPCQSFSVAGLRGGLGDDRGNLALEYLRLADRLRPRWLVWENVPGVLSSNGGRDFGAILGGMVQLGYGWAYRVLDAQYVRVDGYERAVPQRRRRVFVVGHLGSWQRAAAVLFERESLRWNPAPRRAAGQKPAPTIDAGTQGGGGLGTDFDCDGGLILSHHAAQPLLAKSNASHRADAESYVAVAFGGGNQSGPVDVATAQTAHGGTGRHDFESETFVAHAPMPLPLLVHGAQSNSQATTYSIMPMNSGKDYKARETDVAQPIMAGGPAGGNQDGVAIAFDETQITSAANRSNPQPDDPCHPLASGARPPTIAFSAKDHGADAMADLSPTLRAGGHATSHANAGVMPAIAFHARQDPDSGPVTHPLDTDGTSIGILTQWRVRRLTPTECERLMGFPDGYTAILHRGKPAADGPRYKALGNSMAVNCMRWIGRRIEMVEAIYESRLEAAE